LDWYYVDSIYVCIQRGYSTPRVSEKHNVQNLVKKTGKQTDRQT